MPTKAPLHWFTVSFQCTVINSDKKKNYYFITDDGRTFRPLLEVTCHSKLIKVLLQFSMFSL